MNFSTWMQNILSFGDIFAYALTMDVHEMLKYETETLNSQE